MQQEVDYLIVGAGIAGVCFAKQCLNHGKTFHIFTDNEPAASHVAAGLFNPIVIKRFNPVWRTQHQMKLLQDTFSSFEKLLGGQYVHYSNVYRVFSNNQEVRTWKDKVEKVALLKNYLNPEPILHKIDHIESPYGFGEVKGTGWIDLSKLLKDFFTQYQSNLSIETFDYEELRVKPLIKYRNVIAKKVIFAEGIKVMNNPYFNFIPIRPNKGEILIIESDLDFPNVTINSKNFLMPLGDHKFYVGSTYDREWELDGPTAENRVKLIKNLKHYFKADFNILDHKAAFRPTTPNMRPIVGRHPEFSNLYVLNGMGTRGTFNAPDMSRELMDHLISGTALSDEIKVDRYYHLIKR
ncbi:FAD-dependent oxidoreductase [Flavobacteriaceae bacterium Ap0902]|nr:FAD-dependent oxidoreductase [Flavobacteriaceae bacterium Ap0902]